MTKAFMCLVIRSIVCRSCTFISLISAGQLSAAASSSFSQSSDLDKFLSGAGSDMQRYLKSQVEMEKKKKERFQVSGASSPVTTGRGKGNGKGQAMLAKTAASGSKASLSSAQKSQIPPQQKAGAVPRPRKGSIKDVVEMLTADQNPKTPVVGQPGHTKATSFSSKICWNCVRKGCFIVVFAS